MFEFLSLLMSLLSLISTVRETETQEKWYFFSGTNLISRPGWPLSGLQEVRSPDSRSNSQAEAVVIQGLGDTMSTNQFCEHLPPHRLGTIAETSSVRSSFLC